MKELLEILAKSLVSAPDDVSVQEESAANSVVLKLKVAEDDLGKVIGKQGRTIGALRTILAVASSRQNKHAVIEIVE